MPKLKPAIIFEDDNLLVLDKPAGLVVHEGVAVTEETLVDFVAQHLKSSPLKSDRWGLLHRLDKDTSGVILVAKTKLAFDFLKKTFQDRAVSKEYLVLLKGKITPKEGVIRIPLGRSATNRTSFAPKASGRIAETQYQTVENLGNLTYIKAYPKTGRTHQIRVHFAGIGHPVVGDTVYGKPEPGLSRHFLHAHQISFTDWVGEPRAYTSPLPDDLKDFLNGLK